MLLITESIKYGATHTFNPQVELGLIWLQCFDTVGWASGRAFGLQKN